MEAKLLQEAISLRKRAWAAAGDSSDLGCAGQCLRYHQSFRLLASAAQDRLVGFRVLYRTLLRYRTRSTFQPDLRTPEGGALVLDGRSHNQSVVSDYVAAMIQGPVGHFVSRDDLPGPLGLDASKLPLRWWRYALVTALVCLVKADRLHRALGIFTVLEEALILGYVAKHDIQHVVDFAPYLLDSNALYLLLQTRGIAVTKVPSSGPLKTHNHILLADAVALSTPYHVHEMALFQGSFRVQKVHMWIPERALEYVGKYATTAAPATQPFTLGYYSHGGWVRSDADHTSDGLHIHKQEEELLTILGRFLKDKPDWTLVVFPHPREKAAEMQEKTQAYYSRFLPLDRIDLRLSQTPTSQQFEAADVGVAVFSTIVYERLFCGYKTRIFNSANPDFPAKGTELNAICCRSESALVAAVLQAVDNTANQDFEGGGLQGYRWDAYPQVMPA